jgi:hypothetical protein
MTPRAVGQHKPSIPMAKQPLFAAHSTLMLQVSQLFASNYLHHLREQV